MNCSVAPELAATARTVVCIVQPFDWRIYIAPFLILLSAGIAIIAMLMQRKVARQRATLDFIEKVESGDHYRKIVHTFTELRRGKGFAHLTNPQTDDDIDVRRCVNDYMNHYEMVAIGIRTGILDKKFYRDWMRGPFVRDWNAIAAWVQLERWKRLEDGTWKYHGQTFVEYERLARQWSDEAVVLSELSGGPPSAAQAGEASDEPLPPPRDNEKGTAASTTVVGDDAPKGGLSRFAPRTSSSSRQPEQSSGK